MIVLLLVFVSGMQRCIEQLPILGRCVLHVREEIRRHPVPGGKEIMPSRRLGRQNHPFSFLGNEYLITLKTVFGRQIHG